MEGIYRQATVVAVTSYLLANWLLVFAESNAAEGN